MARYTFTVGDLIRKMPAPQRERIDGVIDRTPRHKITVLGPQTRADAAKPERGEDDPKENDA